MIILKYTIQCKFRTIVLPISFLSNVISLSLSFLGGKFRGFFYLFIVIKLVSGLYTMKIVIILCASDRYRSEMGLSEQNYLLNSYNGLFDLSLNFRKKRAWFQTEMRVLWVFNNNLAPIIYRTSILIRGGYSGYSKCCGSCGYNECLGFYYHTDLVPS
jgi:hypothetical protein